MIKSGAMLSAISVLVMALAVVIYQMHKTNKFLSNEVNMFIPDSSVRCLKGFKDVNLCKFKNICYDQTNRALLFFLTNKTTVKGLENYIDLQRIQLSSSLFHNQFYANISIIHKDIYQQIKKPLRLRKKAFLMSRFKPDNLMHVIHDDLLPLFLTLEYLCTHLEDCLRTYQLIIHDNYYLGPYFDLYKLFSNGIPVILNRDLVKEPYLLCFEEMVTGLVQDSIIYDYGYDKVQGPVKNPHLKTRDIDRFSSFIVHKLGISHVGTTKTNIVVIHRVKSRKILNINDLVNMVKEGHKKVYSKSDPKVLILDVQAYSTADVIRSVMNCDILIGMHGAGMILSIFSRKPLIVFELFPFGIEPELTSYLKPISELEDSIWSYFYWKNMDKNKSLPHPDANPLFGGINHLDDVTKEAIKNAQSVPAVKCCHDPNYLYHMYQDTWIADAFRTFFTKSLRETTRREHKRKKIFKWFFPYIPSNITCMYDINTEKLSAMWIPPFNVNHEKDLLYDVHVADENHSFAKSLTTVSSKLTLIIPKESAVCPKFHLWIYAFFGGNDSRSKDTYQKCTCVTSGGEKVQHE